MANPVVEPNSQGALPKDINTQGDPKNVSHIPPPPVNVAPKKEDVTDAGDTVKPVEKTAEQKATEAAVAAKAAEDKAVEDAKNAPKDDGQYITMEDASGQAVINLLKEAGVSRVEADAIFAEGLKSRDTGKINWALLEAKLGPDKSALAKIGIEKFYNDKVVAVDTTVKRAHEIVGGPDNWKVIADWVADVEKVDPSRVKQFNDIRKAIEAGGYVAEIAVKDLKAQYDADPKTNGLGVQKIVAGDQNPSNVQGEPLTRGEYYKLRQEAERAGANQQAIATLWARRRAGMNKGI